MVLSFKTTTYLLFKKKALVEHRIIITISSVVIRSIFLEHFFLVHFQLQSQCYGIKKYEFLF